MNKKLVRQFIGRVIALRRMHVVLIAIALVLSVGLMTAQRVFYTSLEVQLNQQAAELLTADLEFATNSVFKSSDVERLEAMLPAFNVSERHIYSTMVQTDTNQTRLVEMVAVESNYPLRGNCTARNADNVVQSLQTVLDAAPNAVVIAKALADQTQLTIGSTVTIGDFVGTVTGIIQDEPDISVQSLRLGPRLYIRLSNSVKTGFDKQLSRHYQSRLYAFERPTDALDVVVPIQAAFGINPDSGRIQGSFGPSQPLVIRSYQDVSTSVMDGFNDVLQFFIILTLFMMILSASGVAFIIWTSVIQQLPHIGHLRLIGVSVRAIIARILNQLVWAMAAVIVIGEIVGIVVAAIVLKVLVVSINLPGAGLVIQWVDLLAISGFALVMMVGVALVTLRVLQSNRVFDQLSSEQRRGVSLWTLGTIGCLVVGFMVAFLALNQMALVHIWPIIIGFFACFFLFLVIDALVFPAMKVGYRMALPLPLRLAMMLISRGHTLRRIAFVCLCFSLTVLLSVAHYEQSLRNELDPNASNQRLPSIFMLDLADHQVTDFKQTVAREHNLGVLAKSRIQRINGMTKEAYQERISPERRFFLHREQNLTTRPNLLDSETLVAGRWFNPNDGIVEASVEERFASQLKLSLGDTLEFSFYGMPLHLTVTSIRNVDWGTFEPNFFICVEPPFLDPFPKTWVGSIQTTSTDDTIATIQRLVEVFPNVTLIDIYQVAKKITMVLGTFLLSIQGGALSALAIGGLVLVLMVSLLTDIRRESLQMLTWIGMTKRQVNQTLRLESSLFLWVVVLVSIAMSIGVMWGLLTLVAQLPLSVHWVSVIWLVSGLVLVQVIMVIWRN